MMSEEDSLLHPSDGVFAVERVCSLAPGNGGEGGGEGSSHDYHANLLRALPLTPTLWPQATPSPQAGRGGKFISHSSILIEFWTLARRQWLETRLTRKSGNAQGLLDPHPRHGA
jgi:hypothetical protein